MKYLFVHRFDRLSGSVLRDTLAAFVGPRELDVGAMVSELEKEVDMRLVPDELIILCRESVAGDVCRFFSSSGAFGRLQKRLLKRTPVTLISFGGNGDEYRRMPLDDGGEVSDVVLTDLLRRGATAIFRDNNGFVESTSAYHFRNPSGRHTGRFIRLSNILVRQSEITFIALCALRHIPEATTAIYVDTPSLFAVVAAINDVRSSEDKLPPVLVDSFRSYDGVDTYAYFRTGGAVALVSASSSGKLAERLVQRGFDGQRTVHVLFLGERSQDIIAAVDLAHDRQSNPDGFARTVEADNDTPCSMCVDGSIAIPIQGDQFDIAGPQPPPLVIARTKEHAALAATMARHVGTGTFQINAGRPTRQFAINAAKVGTSDDAKKRLVYLAAASVPAKLGHCIVANDESAPFARRVLDAAGSTAPILTRQEFEAACAAVEHTFMDPILVVSAVVGSGRQLLDISRMLRSCPDAPLLYFAGLVATESVKRTLTLTRNLALTHNAAEHPLIIVDQINLPGMGAPNPWNRELAVLDETVYRDLPISAELEQRRARLRQTSMGLEQNLFLNNAPGDPLKIQRGFAFWPEDLPDEPNTQADVFFTIAAILQGLRTGQTGKQKQTLRTEWFYRTLLSPENFDRFNDAVIQASLLRAARPSELDYTDNAETSAEAARIIRRIIGSAIAPSGEAAAEFLVALATERLKLAKRDLAVVLTDLPPQTPLIDELVALCCRRLLLPSTATATSP